MGVAGKEQCDQHPSLCVIILSVDSGISEPEFYDDLVYKFKKLIGINDFSIQKNHNTLQTYRL